MRLLQIESPQMEIGFLTKQLLLMGNKAKELPDSNRANKEWQQLLDLTIQKEIYLSRLVASE